MTQGELFRAIDELRRQVAMARIEAAVTETPEERAKIAGRVLDLVEKRLEEMKN